MQTAERVRPAQRTDRRPERPHRLAGTVVLGLVLFALLAVVGAAMGSDPQSYNVIGAILVTPVIIVVTIPFLKRQALRDGDNTLTKLLILALLIKLAGALARYFVGVGLYASRGDAFAYHQAGISLAAGFRHGSFALGGRHFTDTQFLEILTGIVYTIIGPSMIGGFIFFSWLGFIGLAFLYRAFTIGVPEGNKRTYAKLVFFLPSLVFWPSSIGKESWMMFCLGIATLGAARLLTGQTARGFLITALGAWWAGIVRPHIAGLVGVSIAAGFLVRPVSPRFKSIAPVAKTVGVLVVGALTAILVVKANHFLQTSNVDTSNGITGVLDTVAQRTSHGGSSYHPPVFNSPARAPAAVMTVLFRPTVLEAHSGALAVAALEGSFLFLFTLWRIRGWLGALRRIFKQPFLMFVLVYSGASIVVLSSISNFGILTRERTQLFPLYLMFLAIPPVVIRKEKRRVRSTGATT